MLWITRFSNEWKVVWYAKDDPLDYSFETLVPYGGEIPVDNIKMNRYGLKKTSDTVILSPSLADRPVVARPETPLYVPSDEQVTLYISTPLWVQVEVGASPRLLQEIPVYQPSDTWFGPLTTEGELCYATRTSARLRLDDLPVRYHRAVTGVFIRNKAKDPLFVDRLKLPVPHFSLFKTRDGLYYTEAVTLEREPSGDNAELRLGRKPHKEAGDTEKVASPREPLEKNLVTRTIQSLFG
jgi:hypothetical protein